LFNLLLSFVALFFLSFLLVNKPQKKEKENVRSNDLVLITMTWEANCDMDLWVRLPDNRYVGYSRREEPPVHLDTDVVKWRKFNDIVMKQNQEISSIRGVLPGQYTVNVHYFSPRQHKGPVKVSIMIQNVQSRKIIYMGEKKILKPYSETHFVKFTVEETKSSFKITDIVNDRPEFFIRKIVR